jgi:hypothetical protein
MSLQKRADDLLGKNIKDPVPDFTTPVGQEEGRLHRPGQPKIPVVTTVVPEKPKGDKRPPRAR